MSHPYDAIPELAGVATYSSAARIGYPVAENVRRLLRYHWTERRIMQTLVARTGRRMLKREGITAEQAENRAKDIHDKTWAALDGYRHLDEQHNWWPAFVRDVLGHDSAVARLA